MACITRAARSPWHQAVLSRTVHGERLGRAGREADGASTSGAWLVERDAAAGHVTRDRHVTPLSVRRGVAESFAPLHNCFFITLIIPSRGVALHYPPPPPTVHERRAQQGDGSLDAAGPFSPAFWPIVILRPGKDSWGPGLHAPLFRLPAAATPDP